MREYWQTAVQIVVLGLLTVAVAPSACEAIGAGVGFGCVGNGFQDCTYGTECCLCACSGTWGGNNLFGEICAPYGCTGIENIVCGWL